MALTNTDKMIICKHYDSLLSQLSPISKFMKHPIYPNFINFDYEPTDHEQSHIESAFNIATTLTSKISSGSREDILNFIGQPGFYPEIHIGTRVLNKYSISLEDTILYRNVSESIIVTRESRKKEEDSFVKLTKCYKINLSRELNYVLERTLVIPENIFDLFVDIIKRNNGEMLDYKTFYELVWQEIIKREGHITELKITNNFTSNKDLEAYLTTRYGQNYKKYWNHKGIIRLDNRKPLKDQKNPERISITYKKSL